MTSKSTFGGALHTSASEHHDLRLFLSAPSAHICAVTNVVQLSKLINGMNRTMNVADPAEPLADEVQQNYGQTLRRMVENTRLRQRSAHMEHVNAI